MKVIRVTVIVDKQGHISIEAYGPLKEGGLTVLLEEAAKIAKEAGK